MNFTSPYLLCCILIATAVLVGFPGYGHAGDKGTPDPLQLIDACRSYIQHHPRPDVTYQGGADVHGNAVAPAETTNGKLPSGAIAGGAKNSPIEVEIDIAERLGITLGRGVNADMPIAYIQPSNDVFLQGDQLPYGMTRETWDKTCRQILQSGDTQ